MLYFSTDGCINKSLTYLLTYYIVLHLNKSNSDLADPSSCRPISNLSVLPKLLEHLVVRRLLEHLDWLVWLASTSAVCLLCQPLHWNGRVKSAVRHFARHRQRRPVLPGVTGLVFSIRHGRSPHLADPSSCGVPQRSVFGPILFLLYTADLLSLIDDRVLQVHLCAGDIQLYGFCPPSESHYLQMHISSCIDEVATCMCPGRLKLNANKTECIWLSSSRQVHYIPQEPLHVGSDLISPVSIIRDLGIYLDSEMSIRSHVGGFRSW